MYNISMTKYIKGIKETAAFECMANLLHIVQLSHPSIMQNSLDLQTYIVKNLQDSEDALMLMLL